MNMNAPTSTNRLTPERQERTAYHESGHCLGALAFGIEIRSVTVRVRPHLHHGPLPSWLAAENLLTLILAGPECERLYCGALDDGGDRFDLAAAYRHLRVQCSPLRVLAEFERARRGAQARSSALSRALPAYLGG
jgi:hypothetical protein